jgi:integral membrane protein
MTPMSSTTEESLTLRWFWVLGRLEGASLLALMGIAMPLKYLAHMPAATSWTGWIHGFLFLVFLVALASARRTEGWPFSRLVWGFLASLVPFGTFVLERRIRRA